MTVETCTPRSTAEPVTVHWPNSADLAAAASERGAGLAAGGSPRAQGVGRRVQERLQLGGALAVALCCRIFGRIIPGQRSAYLSVCTAAAGTKQIKLQRAGTNALIFIR